MAKATIKSKSGALITIEGSDTEVSSILAAFERTTVVGQAKEAIARSRVERKNERKREGAREIIVGLRESGFFDKPKELRDIAGALEEKGYFYPTTTLSGVVLGLVKKKELRRKKLDGRWAYGK